jgi:ribosomal protein L11 methyltransferase
VYTDGGGEDQLRGAFGESIRSTAVDADWQNRWRSFHAPVQVGPVWIGPSWATPPSGVVALVIDPGRAFGTGGHPSTRLALELLLGCERRSLLDVGCGSGVLALAAVRLGFAPVIAIDRAAASVEATERNAAANGLTLDVRQLDALASAIPPVDIAVANIDLATTEAIAARINVAVLITSGYLEYQQPSTDRFMHAHRATVDGWAADLYQRR